MQRAALCLLIGIGLGAAGAYYYDARHASTPTIDPSDLALPASDQRDRPSEARLAVEPKVIDALAASPRGTVQRAALYVAAARADVGEIQALVAKAAVLADQATRTFALDVLLTRYAELDAGGAVATAADLNVPPSSLVALYRAWIKSSPSAALASLSKLDDAKASMIARDLVAQAGDDEALVDRILAAVPARLTNELISISVSRVARESPTEALARARRIADPAARSNAVNQVIRVWAERDPRAALDYVATLDAAARRDALNNGLWQQVALADPELALDRIDTLPADLRAGIQQTALQTLAQKDPQAALARVAQMPRGEVRQQLLQTVARGFAEHDPDAALQWARSLDPPEPGVLAIVISGLAAKDPMRAIDVAAQIESPMEQTQAMRSAYMSATSRDPSLFAPLLERVLALANTGQKQGLVQSLVASWAARDAVQAADWVLSNGARVPPDVVTQVASQYARADPARAVSYTARIPSDVRAAWLRGVASGYAQTDPRAALDWVEQLRGSPEYDDAAIAVVQSAAQLDPAAAARVLDTIGREDYRRNGVGIVARTWASRDPAGAASWAAALHDPATRTSAMIGVAQLWATQDPTAAQAWMLSQPPGQARDTGLIAVIGASARFATPDASLLSAFSSEQTRIAAVQAAAFGIAQRDPDAASAFITANVADASQRDRLLSIVKQLPIRPGGGIGVSPAMPVGVPMGAAPFGPVGVPVIVDGARAVQSQQTAPPPPRDGQRR